MKILNKFPRTPILVIGDLMLDRFIWGDIKRISPEAPVPVLETLRETYAPGGSGNVVNNLSDLEANIYAAGIIGSDQHGNMLMNEFKKRNIDVSGIYVDKNRPTTSKTRIIARNQQVLRMDMEKSQELDSEIFKFFDSYISKTVPKCKGVVISDYGKGVISRHLLKKIITCARKHHQPIMVDPKIEHFQQYKYVTCMTPNLQEAQRGMNRFKVETDAQVDDLGKSILKKLHGEAVLITRGAKGMDLFESKKPPVHIPAAAHEVFDVTGAGDTVIAVLSLAVACGASLRLAAKISNQAAGLVVGKIGTATVTLKELKDIIRSV